MHRYNVTVQVVYSVLAESPEKAMEICQQVDFSMGMESADNGVAMVDWDYDVEDAGEENPGQVNPIPYTREMQKAQDAVLECLVELSTEEAKAVLESALICQDIEEEDGQVESPELNPQQAQDHQHDWEWEEEKPLND